MKGTKYLSDVLDVSQLRTGELKIINAPCGCGKTTCAINKIAELASSPRKVLYLIDTANGCERLAQEEKLTAAYHSYEDDIAGHFFTTELPENEIIVATYARFGTWAKKYPNFASHFEIILCDEAHNLVQFAKYSPEPNYTSIARDAIYNALILGGPIIVAISATPRPLSYFDHRFYIPIDKEQLRQYDNREIIPYVSIQQVLKELPREQRGALYVPRIREMQAFEAEARAAGRHPICVWSTNNEEHPMTEEQLRVRQFILDNEAVPPEYDLFIMNASCETAINIRSHMDFFIAHTTDKTQLTQARGRYRGDLERLYVLDKQNGSIRIPEKYLNRSLDAAEKRAMRKELNLKNSHGNLLPWKELIPLLNNSGYITAEQNKRGKNYLLIQR